jgi:hypothetical protein
MAKVKQTSLARWFVKETSAEATVLELDAEEAQCIATEDSTVDSTVESTVDCSSDTADATMGSNVDTHVDAHVDALSAESAHELVVHQAMSIPDGNADATVDVNKDSNGASTVDCTVGANVDISSSRKTPLNGITVAAYLEWILAQIADQNSHGRTNKKSLSVHLGKDGTETAASTMLGTLGSQCVDCADLTVNQ